MNISRTVKAKALNMMTGLGMPQSGKNSPDSPYLKFSQ
jgi:hypothetical protein